MSPHLPSFLVALQALAAATTSLSNCNHGGGREVVVEGWPVLVALRFPYLATANMTLRLSLNEKIHTKITLLQSVLNNAGILQVRLESVMMLSPLNTATQLVHSSWGTFRISAHAKELQINVVSESHSFKYSTSVFVNTIHHQEVNKVSCIGRGCDYYIDLKCLYKDVKSNHTEVLEPDSISNISNNNTVYYWMFYLVVSLVVVACLLLFIWRNERQKFRMRWWRHSQNVRRITSASVQEGCSSQADGTSLAISNPAYDETGDSG